MEDFKLGKYAQFFDVDEKYFPCIDDSAIAGGARWNTTYPHEAFIRLLNATEEMLSGSTNRSVWIHGSYGTGKSQCAFALKKILEVPEEELKTYWESYEPLKKEKDLLTKLLGHRDRGIVTVYRYATGGITTPQKLFTAIQESVKKALEDSSYVIYNGENTLKETVISWIEEDIAHKNFFNALLEKPEWMAKFSQSNADEVLNTLKKSSEVKELMSNIFELADKEGIKAMHLDADKLKNWLKDVIGQNNIKIVFFWDEFSKFFENNKHSLDEFQKIVALCQEIPFYFVIVTHQAGSIIDNQDESWKVVQQRFRQIEITLPDNIAFDLIGHAFKIKSAARETWNTYADALNSRLNDSRNAVMKEVNINSQKVIKDIMPIHPMAALVLKNIASAFASNQRSMFDFIKVRDDSQAFQWFISEYGPDDDYPLLTIDMLWDFFYEKGKDNLSPDIRMILDVFPQHKNLRDDQQRVLKTILIMQAISKRLGGALDILKPTEQNISYAFEGISSGLDIACKNIAKNLCNNGVLVKTPIGNNKFTYEVAVLAGDQGRINELKKSIKNSCSTARLVSEGKLGNCLSLSSALKLRFADENGQIIPVTINDFTKKINILKEFQETWHFNAVIAFAKDINEGKVLRNKIKTAIASGDYDNIVIIDATSSPLGDEDFDAYVEYSAMANYYQGNNTPSSLENSKKASSILSINWKNRIYDGTFIIWSKDYVDGEKVTGNRCVADILKTIVLKKFKYVPDFGKGLTETQFKLTNAKAAALCGINQKTSGIVMGAEKSTLSGVWGVDEYWKKPETSEQGISIIKRSIEDSIEKKFDNNESVSIYDIYECLVFEYGYAPSNLTSFMLGFLLKEYSLSKFRYIDTKGANGEMTPDKLAELIANCISNKMATYIVKMTPEERAFYEVTEKAWGIDENTLSSPSRAAMAIKSKMKSLEIPVWCLKYIDNDGIYNMVTKYIEFVQKEGADAHLVVNEIGAEVLTNKTLMNSLKNLLTAENCRKGMLKFVDCFDDGKLRILADEIGTNDDRLLTDIKRLFSVTHSDLWNLDTGEDQIRRLIVDYTYVKATNDILNVSAHSKKEADSSWHEKLNYVMCSCEALQEECRDLKGTFEFLRKIYLDNDILPDKMASYTDGFVQNTLDIERYLSNEVPTFAKIYAPYLEGISEDEIPQLRTTELVGIFKKSKTESNAIVKKIADEFRKNQTKTQLFKLWKSSTDSKTPESWSAIHRTPVLAIVPKTEYDSAKKTFDILNRGNAPENELKEALDFLGKTTIFAAMKDKEKVDIAFRNILGIYKKILTDIDKVRDALEILPINAYEWGTHPLVQDKIRELAKAEYDSGVSDKAIAIVNAMGRDEIKEYLVSLIKKDIILGIEIINGGE